MTLSDFGTSCKSETSTRMAVNDSLVVTSRLSSIKAVEDALYLMPDNPLRDPFAVVWMYMTNNFTKFQIATFGSFIVHEVCITYTESKLAYT